MGVSGVLGDRRVAVPDAGDVAGRAGSARFVQATVLALPVVWILAVGWTHRFMTEDGFIYLRVVEQVRAGNGPVFNQGERVEAFTGPLWVALLSIADLATPGPTRMAGGPPGPSGHRRSGLPVPRRCTAAVGPGTPGTTPSPSPRRPGVRGRLPGLGVHHQWARDRPGVRLARWLLLDPGGVGRPIARNGCRARRR